MTAPRRFLLNIVLPLAALTAAVGSFFLEHRAVPVAPEPAARTVRIGFLPNLTHAQPLVASQRGDFARALEGTAVEFRTFNAGPAVIEALLSGELDLAYVGPSPALNAFARSGGAEVRVIAGAAANGVSVVTRPGSGIRRLDDLAGRRLATPQWGNTQDIAARTFLAANPAAARGTTLVNAENPDIFALFQRGDLDAAWVPEPWASRLVLEAGGDRLAEEKDLWTDRRFAVTLVVARRGFLEANPGVIRRFLDAHATLTEWLRAHPAEGAAAANDALRALTGKPLPEPVLREAWPRVEFTTDLLSDSIREQARRAVAIGFIPRLPPLSPLFAESLP